MSADNPRPCVPGPPISGWRRGWRRYVVVILIAAVLVLLSLGVVTNTMVALVIDLVVAAELLDRAVAFIARPAAAR
ncbi:MAG TPA: hypothetical protein VM677_11640 [Actinokineospora sp.]|jgi:hypothetical protein|nr:hypothetical protein [Actinokineospora sp.]